MDPCNNAHGKLHFNPSEEHWSWEIIDVIGHRSFALNKVLTNGYNNAGSMTDMRAAHLLCCERDEFFIFPNYSLPFFRE
jgi:hypothetical protein